MSCTLALYLSDQPIYAIVFYVIGGFVLVLNGYNPSENSLTCRSVDFLFFDSYLSGHLKFWKKKALGIEFAKHFRSHLGPIEGLAVSTLHFVQACVCVHACAYV